MQYRLQFKGDENVYVREGELLFKKTQTWDRARITEQIVGDVAILHSGHGLSENLVFEKFDREPGPSQVFFARWVDDKVTFKAPNGKYLEVKSEKVVLESVAVGPHSQFAVTFVDGQAQIWMGKRCLAIVDNKLVTLSEPQENSRFVLVHK